MIKNTAIIIIFWVVSLISAFLLFKFLNSFIETDNFMGFKVSGGIAGCILIFMLLFKKFEDLNYKSEIEIHLRDFEGEVPENLKNCKFEYRIISDSNSKKWKTAEFISQDKDRFVFIRHIGINDIIELRIKADNGMWYSDKVQSSKRHLLFSKQ